MTREALGLVGLVALVSESAMVNRVKVEKGAGRKLAAAVRPDVPGVSAPGTFLKKGLERDYQNLARAAGGHDHDAGHWALGTGFRMPGQGRSRLRLPAPSWPAA